MSDAFGTIEAAALRAVLADGGEIAFVDVREEGEHGAGHPLLAVNLPYSRLEAEIAALVPRRDCRIVLVDGNDGVAGKAARRLALCGYRDIRVLAGGATGWEAAGHRLFPSTNVPSKGFAEIIEHDEETPAITASELDALRKSGRDLVVLDSRTVEEYGRFHVPGAITCPGAELVHRFADLVPSRETLVVVSCAGRTRSIIGAQSLINARVPNRVVSLSGGTQGWRLAGLDLETGPSTRLEPVSAASAAAGRHYAADVALRFAVPRINRATLQRWQAETGRTTCLLDVRTPQEFAAGHLPGSVSAPGGQLVQAIDRWVGTRGARLVLVDDTLTRATMTAHWLRQMGWDAQILENAFAEPVPAAAAAPSPGGRAAPVRPDLPVLAPAEAAVRLAQGAAAISLEASAAYRAAHAPGAVWSIRPRLDRLPAAVLGAAELLVFAEDPGLAALAAIDLSELSKVPVSLVAGGTPGWRAAGLPVDSSADTPPDAERIDYLFWNHDRHAGNSEAMRAYLRWETELPAQLAAEGNAGFRLVSRPGGQPLGGQPVGGQPLAGSGD
jgi:rhodanese-related sulfurtransferase